nr:uncharacterized protein LOC126534380 isoform X5 [Dermacentor andersoni]
MTAVASTARWTSRRCFFPGFDNKFCHNTSRWVMSAVRIAVLFYLPLALSGVTLKDLKEALNTREKIWTVYRSYYPSARGHNQTCIYSEMRMTKRGYYIADTHYEVDGVWKSERNYARLISSKREPVMRVSPDLAQRGLDYTLHFWAPKEHCVVFLLVLAGTSFEGYEVQKKVP